MVTVNLVLAYGKRGGTLLALRTSTKYLIKSTETVRIHSPIEVTVAMVCDHLRLVSCSLLRKVALTATTTCNGRHNEAFFT